MLCFKHKTVQGQIYKVSAINASHGLNEWVNCCIFSNIPTPLIMKAIIGRKIGMSQTFSPEGESVPVTLISAQANTVTLRRTEEKDGYISFQLSIPKNAKKENNKELISREFRGELSEDIKELDVTQFENGDVVHVIGTSKGKGYQGVVKRHHFKGGPASHGHRHVLRSGGSIGAAYPQHVMKCMRMAGRMGGDRITVKNLTIVAIDKQENILAVKGAIPGKPGSLVQIKTIDE